MYCDVTYKHVSRSYCTLSKVLSQYEIFPSNPNAATLPGVELLVVSCWRNAFGFTGVAVVLVLVYTSRRT